MILYDIERADDPRLAVYADVGDHERLRKRRLFVAEGRLVVRRLIEARRFEIDSIVVTPAALNGLRSLLDTGDWPVFVCDQRVIESLTGIDFHRGCLALARRPGEPIPLSRFRGVRRLLALEGIGNPDNLGGLFRVAATFGAGGVLLSPTCGDPYYRKAIRTSVGAVLRVPFAIVDRWPADLQRMRDDGFRIVAFTPHASATPLGEFAAAVEPDSRLIIMFGAEGPGLTPEAMRQADHTIRIPMAADVDSLNVTVAAGIALAFLNAW